VEFEGTPTSDVLLAINKTVAAAVQLYVLLGFGADSFALEGSDTAKGLGSTEDASLGGKFVSVIEV
jgi:hypothetical protein